MSVLVTVGVIVACTVFAFPSSPVAIILDSGIFAPNLLVKYGINNFFKFKALFNARNALPPVTFCLALEVVHGAGNFPPVDCPTV